MIDEAEQAAIGWAVTQLVYRATALTDAGAWEKLADLYLEDGVLARPSAPDQPIVGRTAILAASRARPPRTSRHVVSNPVVTIVSADEARVTSTLLLFTGPVGDGVVTADGTIMIGSFDDHVRRVDGQWKFARRTGTMAMQYRPDVPSGA